MDKLSLYDTELSPREALAEAVASFNHKELIRGFSPAQHILGQAPDETGRFLAASQQLPPDLQGEFARSVKLRAEAEKAQSDWSAEQRIQRALHSRHRPCFNYRPGELVFYWRTQEANKSRRQPGGKHGRFLGPARILATESRTEEDGTIRPGGAIWLVKGRSLLRRAVEESHTTRGAHRVPVGTEYPAGSMEFPCRGRADWRKPVRRHHCRGAGGTGMASSSEPTRFRFRTKRPAEQALEPLEQGFREDLMEDDPGEQGSSRTRSRGQRGSAANEAAAAAW